MTREEAITILNMVEAHGSLVVQAKDMAIKALKQESVLDKIRAEIADLDDANYDYEGYYKAVTDAVKIIDKYRAESEE